MRDADVGHQEERKPGVHAARITLFNTVQELAFKVAFIIGAARTGDIGDGRVFVTPVLGAYRIRSGEREG